jgi:hypothetical protein
MQRIDKGKFQRKIYIYIKVNAIHTFKKSRFCFKVRKNFINNFILE